MNTISYMSRNCKWDYPVGTFSNGRTKIDGTTFVVENILDRVILTWQDQSEKEAEHCELTSDEWFGLLGEDNMTFLGYLVGANLSYGSNSKYSERLRSLLCKLRVFNKQKDIRRALMYLTTTCNDAYFFGTDFPNSVHEALNYASDVLEMPYIEQESGTF